MPDEFHGSATLRISAYQSGLMPGHAGIQIIGMTDIIMSVHASEHIGPECHGSTIARTRPSTSSGRTEEGEWPELLKKGSQQDPFVLSLSKDRDTHDGDFVKPKISKSLFCLAAPYVAEWAGRSLSTMRHLAMPSGAGKCAPRICC